MAGTGSFDCSDLKELKKELEALQRNTDAFIEACAKELAARLLRKVIKRTPVGDYSHISDVENGEAVQSAKKGGTLRRGWTGGANTSASGYADSLPVHQMGGNFVIEITNPVEYASYVEYGHRQEAGRYVPAIGKRLKKGWVNGHFMLTISEQEIRQSAPQILERKIKKYLGDAFR